MKVAIQGFEGSFHQQAAQKFFGKKVAVIPCASFREVAQLAADTTKSDGGVMAIENSIAGSILPNYNLLQQHKVQITGEVYLQINQHLMVNPGVGLEQIREVHSHPMALLQCMDYLTAQNWKLVETEDTALSAKYIHQKRSKHIAAIAGKGAAELYDLEIIAPNIQSMKNNYTRFLILQNSKAAKPVEFADKASIVFATDHSKGSLAKVLTVIAKEGINLSKLQSFPIPGSKWNYSFHADLEFDLLPQIDKTVKKIRAVTQTVNVYGIYKRGKTI